MRDSKKYLVVFCRFLIPALLFSFAFLPGNLFCARAESQANGFFTVYLQPGTYDLKTVEWSSASKIIVNQPGDYWLKGKTGNYRFTFDPSAGDINVYLMNGLVVKPGGNATLFGTATCAFYIADNGGTVRLITDVGAKAELVSYGSRPAIQKDGTKTKLIFQTRDPAKPGTLIARAEEGGYRTCAIGSYCFQLLAKFTAHTSGNMEFQSGNIEAYGSQGYGTIKEGGAAIGADSFGSVDGLWFTGANVLAVGGDSSCAAIGTSTAYAPLSLLSEVVDDYFQGSVARNISISAGTVKAIHARQSDEDGGAGIGGGQGCSADGITISGGTVYAEGCGDAAAIGGGYNGDGLRILISGGQVTAKGGATGIGSGYAYDASSDKNGAATVTISGGTVQAVARRDSGVGIGGWKTNGSASTVTITGGNVTAQGSGYGAGIGGSVQGTLKNITISGGVITALGGNDAVAIGTTLIEQQATSFCPRITISGGTVTARGGENAGADLGGYAAKGWENRNATVVVISGGNVKAEKGAWQFTPRNAPNGSDVFPYKISLETYGDSVPNITQCRLKQAATLKLGSDYSYGLNDIYPFADSPELCLWLPDDVTCNDLRFASAITKRGDMRLTGMIPAHTGGTSGSKIQGVVYPLILTVLDANTQDTQAKDGSMLVFYGLQKGQTLIAPVREGYEVSAYAANGNALPVLMSADGAFVGNVAGYTSADGAWTRNGAQYYQNGLTLFTVWEEYVYQVRFEGNKPSHASTVLSGSMSDQTIQGSHTTELSANAFVLPGYVFTGWNTAPDGSGTSYTDQAAVMNLAKNGETLQLYAQWQPKEYNVTFSPGTGSGSMASQMFLFDTVQKIAPNVFTHTQSIFAGWFSDAASGGRIYADAEEIVNLCVLNSDGSLTGGTLTAQWIAVGSVVAFVTKDDLPWNNLSVSLKNETSLNLSYVSSGRYESNLIPAGTYALALQNGLSKYQALDPVIVAENQTKTLHIDFCTVDILGDDHVSATVNDGTDPVVLQEGGTVRLAASTDVGYVFDGYSATDYQPIWDKASTVPAQSPKILGRTTIIPHARAAVYHVRFDPNYPAFMQGGLTSAPVQDMVYGEPQKLFANLFTLDKCAFVGWSLTPKWQGRYYADGETVKNLAHTDGETVTLYALWTPSSYFVRFHPNGDTSGEMLDQKMFLGIASNLAPNAYTNLNYHFTGWNTNAGGSGVSYADEQEVLNLADANQVFELYAQWEHDVYTVVFHANDGTDKETSQTLWHNENEFLPSHIFDRLLYSIVSWNTLRDGSGNSYLPGEAVYNLTDTGKTFHLYAIWRAIPYQIIYDANGGTGNMPEQTMTPGVAANLLPCAFQNGKRVFTGWNTKAGGTGVHYDDEAEVVDITADGGPVTLYAQWMSTPPPTGDDAVPLLWLLQACAAILLCIALLMRKPRNNRS